MLRNRPSRRHPARPVLRNRRSHRHPVRSHACSISFFAGDGCDVCNSSFNDKGQLPETITHPFHSLHPLKLFRGELPAYTDGKCFLCGDETIYKDTKVFYHCSACNFTLDLRCMVREPTPYLHNEDIHEHQLTLFPKSISFTCTICGLNGDGSSYVCLPCNFIVHSGCTREFFHHSMSRTGYPWVININRHDHRVSRTSLIGVVNAICGICRKKMDWSCGGYSCQKCPDKTFHTTCATSEYVWDGKEMKDEPEEDEDVQAFKVIDENTIQHVSHPDEGHNLRLDKSGIFVKEIVCEVCAYPIYNHPFYSCISCSFILHQSCAYLPLWKRHMLSGQRSQFIYDEGDCFKCKACGIFSNGFKYKAGEEEFDVRCASVTDPFVHKSHPHPLYYTSPWAACSMCRIRLEQHVLRCIEENCGYIMDYRCALLPYKVRHRVDKDILSLCYGEKEEARGKYWCDICEKETDPRKWYYTSKDGELTLHTNCVLGDFRGLKPDVKRFNDSNNKEYVMAVRNNTMSRPFCKQCESRCIFPVIFGIWLENSEPVYLCSVWCLNALEKKKYKGFRKREALQSRYLFNIRDCIA